MSTKNNWVFKGLYIVAWIIFVGLSIEAGGLIVNFVFSIYNPEFVPNLYQKLDLTDMYDQNQWIFYCVYSFILVIAIMKAVLFYLLIALQHKLNLSKPFDSAVSARINKISYYTLSIGLISYIASESTRKLQYYQFEVHSLNQFWGDSQAYILMAAVIYVIATIFARGVELQNENDLTV